MKGKFKKSMACVSLSVLSALSAQSYASDYNLPFVNTSGLGNMYAGWASSAEDASTTYTNPAGLTKIQNKQLVLSAIDLSGVSRFRGTANTIPSLSPTMSGTAASHLGGFLPGIYFAMPVAQNLVFGYGQTIPFALGTNYPKNSVVRYAATRSQIVVMDFTPSIGFKITNKLSAGIGLDFERMAFTLNAMKGFPLSVPDAEGQSHLAGWGYGFHAGLLYDMNQATRIGINYNSQVMVHTTGDSESFTPTTIYRTKSQKASAPLPTLVQLSVQHDFNPALTAMATVFYTHWSSFQQLTLKNTMQPSGALMPVTIPFEYHDTFDYSIGLNYKTNEKLTLKAGAQLLSTPSNNRDRSLPDPVGTATIVAFGAHYQQNKQYGYDFGYAHSFFSQTAINHMTPLEYASGHSNQSTNIVGMQFTWNIV